MKLRQELRAPALDPDQRDRLVGLCGEILDRVVAGDKAAARIYEFNRAVGRVFGPTTFRGVFGSEEPEDFVDRILTPIPESTPEISDDEATEMVRRVLEGEVDDRESWYWVRLLAEHFDQPKFSDLIYWPADELSAAEIVAAAKLSDEEVDEYLDEMARGPVERPEPPARPRDRERARRLLQELSRFELLEVVDDEAAIALVAPILGTTATPAQKATAIWHALQEPFVTSELLASEEQIAAIIPKITELTPPHDPRG